MQTDFPPEPLDAGVPWCSVLGVGGALFTTFALGFTEGCLEIERRPIPLRFALRFAAANVLPSVVFRSVPARHVAAASGVPLSALISDTDVASSRSAVVGKRLVLVKSVRALRLAAGSYGLAWSLWRWHESDTASSNNNGNKEGVKYGESVRARRNRLEEEGEQGERVKVIEVELNDVETTVEYAGELKTKASKKDGTSVYSVAVLPLCGPPIPPSAADSFDVCFSPLSAVLTFIASVCHERGITHVILAVDEEEGGECVEDIVRGASSPWLHLSTSQVATGLLYRHGITSSVLTTRDKKIVDENAEREGGAGHSIDSNSEVVFFISESVSAGHLAARKMSEQGLIVQQNACFIVEESLCGQSVPKEAVQAASELLRTKEQNATEQNATEQQETAEVDEVTYLSVTDVTDQTLQGIRNLVRQGNKPDAIQAAVYRAFGTQRVVAPTRLDQSSDMHI
ncbi:hypothetical protein PC113_g19405 [Phytophthora cactorum]|uniref:Uncharacterized protein n=1 Tax=Phytophthora cactorum TaxID=29920 RepID=A0A8T0YP67_9STRA|nr:hypothetical protein PC112_g19563 [Phytophthora cactorum]KAG2803597.1 hypothetical protein PC111_g18616 [Phytophthora cactorum]KAG2839750.1 hypothetical protein PC113_g19405 [Phytophthora cactorum]KAG2912808.1 hypothetical protein PC114_g8790 [Phytophthora cactorum]KAG2917255.1 hypothetical protein PC117_g17516 [Phytophthora cactorum]